jgi:regulator of protease activity HflC (stomatin/prohibitin superfamily)
LNTWIIFLIVLVPFLAILAWIASSDSLINIPPGRIGLLLVSGRATDKVVQPGLHWVPRLRKRMVAEYPSLELSFRALADGEQVGESGEIDRTGPSVRVILGDRTQASIAYTIRFQLDEQMLRVVHERFGPEGLWTAIRDISGRAVRQRLAQSDVGVDDLVGTEWVSLEDQLTESLGATLRGAGVRVTMFSLGAVDLGRTGEVIQSTVRARLELEREEAEAAVRMARAKIDAELEPFLSAVPDAALRYREVDVWRDLVHSRSNRAVPGLGRPLITWTNAESGEQAATREPQAAEPSDET